jgi:hypothetical protein
MEGAAMNLRGLMQHLARLDLQLAAETALAEQAAAIAEAAHAAGARSGEVRAAGAEVLIGWRSAALRRHENGEVGTPPQSVLAPVVAAQGASTAEAVGAAVAGALWVA